MAHEATPGGHGDMSSLCCRVDVHDQQCHQEAMSMSVVLLQLGVILMTQVHVTTRDFVDVCSLCCCLKSCQGLWFCSSHSPNWCLRSTLPLGAIQCLWSVLSPEIMLRATVLGAATMGHCWICGPATARHYADGCGPGCHWEKCWCLWPPESMLRPVACGDVRDLEDVQGPCCHKNHVEVYDLCSCCL